MKIKEKVECTCQISYGWGEKWSVKISIATFGASENGETVFGGGR